MGTSVTNRGTLRESGGELSTTQALFNDGVVQVDTGSTFTLQGTTTYSAAGRASCREGVEVTHAADGANTVLTLAGGLAVQNPTVQNSTIEGSASGTKANRAK